MLAIDELRVCTDIENVKWEVPSEVKGRVIPFEESLSLIISPNDVFGPVERGREHLPEGRCYGAQHFQRQLLDTCQFYDVAYRCGKCRRIVIDQPIASFKTISQKHIVEFQCAARGCDALLYL